MTLVAYSDSEGSEDEATTTVPKSTVTSSTVTKPALAHFTVDKTSNKVRVNLNEQRDTSAHASHQDEPAAKRPRVGGGAFSGFNAMLPAPKRDNLPLKNEGSKAPVRKVFSLKTGAEASFNREADAEMRQMLEEEGTFGTDNTSTSPASSVKLPMPKFAKPPPPATGNPFMFKPLSVTRGQKKKKLPPPSGENHSASASMKPPTRLPQSVAAPQRPSLTNSNGAAEKKRKEKINLFTSGVDEVLSIPIESEEPSEDSSYPEDQFTAEHDEQEEDLSTISQPGAGAPAYAGSQTLDSIATDLNLSQSERRRLFGRAGQNASATNIINFNTDAEYASNQALIASGDGAQFQHNPVRGIAPGKHSLRQLVNAATGQKEALEESFATGKRNKREAGSKYGW